MNSVSSPDQDCQSRRDAMLARIVSPEKSPTNNDGVPTFPRFRADDLDGWRADIDVWEAEMHRRSADPKWRAWYIRTHSVRAGNVAPPDCKSWPARGEYAPGDMELVQELGLRRPPFHLERHEQTDLLQGLLDLEVTCRRYPNYGEAVRAILRRIMEG